MEYIIDLHLHSRYARACSPQLTLPSISRYCVRKGVNVVAVPDYTHPKMFAEAREQLESAGEGIYKIKDSDDLTRFIFSTEISCIYSKGGRVRRLHIVLMAPSLEVAGEINNALGKIGNLAADGRPILGLDAKELARIVLDISPDCMIIPAHAWTPWFAVFGSKSGFDSLEECFEEYTDKIYAIETGLSSDPAMNWRLSALDRVALVSNSDAHSLPNIAREANVFDLDTLSYGEICRVIREKDRKRFLYTIEFYPEEGMYHYDGHRDCGVVLRPAQTKKEKGICPKCKKPLTVGVSYRVEELADRPEGFVPDNAIPYKNLVELDKIIAESLNIKSRSSKAVQAEFDRMVSQKTELDILLHASYVELADIVSNPRIVEGIRRMREGKLVIQPGFDGQYGQVQIFSAAERAETGQKQLF
ncbi:DNA helicase UvrD [Candidatus Falkowbacteria bacterium]|nr:DNA helicase UvrD [Candidatus Falkowbacteria bacterium]